MGVDRRFVAPPGGMIPPSTAPAPNGREVDLVGPAERACATFERECPEYVERYGTVGTAWFVHDCRHLLEWALVRTQAGFERQLDWLTRVLAARDFPLDQLARGIELLAVEVGHDESLRVIADRLAGGAARVRSAAR